MNRITIITLALSIATVLLLFTALPITTTNFPLLLPCLPTPTVPSGAAYSFSGAASLAGAAVHYATTTNTPQQSHAEISLSLAVLLRRSPCRLLVFGLGRDSVLWAALNLGGPTVFLEEDPTWFRSVRAQHTSLRAHIVTYRTHLSDADALLSEYKTNPACSPDNAFLKGNAACQLALHDLPQEVYDNEWDMIMIDAPKGYFDAAPGRMAAIYSAAVMARKRKGEGDTDVFLHDVDRRVERVFAEELLCDKFKVGAVGRLWHFSIPPVSRRGDNGTVSGSSSSRSFC